MQVLEKYVLRPFGMANTGFTAVRATTPFDRTLTSQLHSELPAAQPAARPAAQPTAQDTERLAPLISRDGEVLVQLAVQLVVQLAVQLSLRPDVQLAESSCFGGFAQFRSSYLQRGFSSSHSRCPPLPT